jgi:hypothetical protein
MAADQIEELKRGLAEVEQERKHGRRDREQLRALIAGWRKALRRGGDSDPARQKEKQALLKALERHLEVDVLEDRAREIEREVLAKRLKALEQPGREGHSP